MKQITLLDLIPQHRDSVIRDLKMRVEILKLLQFILSNAIKALQEFFIRSNYHLFDPHVGDTACQVRAYELLLIANSNVRYQSVISQFELFLGRVETLKASYESSERELFNNVESIASFADRLCILSHFDEAITFVVISYLLTQHALQGQFGSGEIDYKAMMSELRLSRKACKKIIRHWQNYLSELSCSAVYRWAENANSDLLKVLFELEKLDDNGRSVLPCYLHFSLLIEHLKPMGLTLALINFNENTKMTSVLYFSFHHGKFTRTVIEPTSTRPCFVIHGVQTQEVDSFVDQLRFYRLEEILLANMAAHPQYSGELLSCYAENPFLSLKESKYHAELKAELFSMQSRSKQLGCRIDDRRLFYIKHIYLDTCQNISLSHEQVKEVLVHENANMYALTESNYI